MSELMEFLRARLDEDEEAAREAMTVTGDDLATYTIGEWWEKPEHARVYAGHWHPVVQAGETHGEPVFYNTAALPHIARHDPARVLAEVDAKRRIIGLFGVPDPHPASDDCPECNVLYLLALPFADHPDYDERWKP